MEVHERVLEKVEYYKQQIQVFSNKLRGGCETDYFKNMVSYYERKLKELQEEDKV